jgi:hypothetical protein
MPDTPRRTWRSAPATRQASAHLRYATTATRRTNYIIVRWRTYSATSGGHSLIGDPKFVDPLIDDYHLQFGSASIDHGVDAGVYTDLDGHPRPKGIGFDLGAYEYQNIRYLWLPVIRK